MIIIKSTIKQVEATYDVFFLIQYSLFSLLSISNSLMSVIHLVYFRGNVRENEPSKITNKSNQNVFI